MQNGRLDDSQAGNKKARRSINSVRYADDTTLMAESSLQSLSCVWLFVTPWIAAYQASLCITNSRSLLKLMSIKSVMPSSHLILCRPLLLLSPIPPSIRVFSNQSTLHTRRPKYWSLPRTRSYTEDDVNTPVNKGCPNRSSAQTGPLPK